MTFDIPGPEVHSAVVIRNGTRYVGHLTARVDTSTSGSGSVHVITVDEGSRLVQIVPDEIAALETFPGRVVVGCRGCQPEHDRLDGGRR